MSKQLSIQLPLDLAQAIDSMLQREGGTPQDIIEWAVREYLAVHQFWSLRSQMMQEGAGPVCERDIADHVS